MSDPAPRSVADQLAEMEERLEAQSRNEIAELRARYEERDERFGICLHKYRQFVNGVAAKLDVSEAVFAPYTSSRIPAPREDIEHEALDAFTDYVNGRLKMADDFDSVISHIKSDDTLMAIWDDLCLMMKLRQDI